MTSREWRVRVECMVKDIEAVLSYQPKPEDEPEEKYYTSKETYRYVKATTEAALAEAKLKCVERSIHEFAAKYLNRETCDDFDE